MAKMDLSTLKTWIQTMVLANKQLVSSLTTTISSIDLMADKIGRQINITGVYRDPFPELEGSKLQFGKIVEEYFINLTMPVLQSSGAGTITPAYPTFEAAVYSLPLPKYKLKTSIPFNDIEASVNNAAKFSEVLQRIMKAFADSYNITRKYSKLQLLGNAIQGVDASANSANLKTTIAKPTDTTTGEAFLKQVMNDLEVASRENETGSLSGSLIGEAPTESLYLYIKEGINSSIKVDTLAGAFNKDELKLPIKIKAVPNFGDANDSDKTYAMLVDTRGIKLCNTSQFVLSQLNADDAFQNYVKHAQDTAFISNFTYIHIYREA